MTKQEIYNRFFFLEGLVNEATFKRIAEEAIKIQQETKVETFEETAIICDKLSKLYYDSPVGFDMGYTTAVMRAAREVRKLIQEIK